MSVQKNIKLVAVMSNLVDRVWGANKPPSPKGAFNVKASCTGAFDRPVAIANHPSDNVLGAAEIFLHDAMYAGQEVSSKLAQIAKHLDEASCGCLVLTALDEIAWTFNLRGSDIMCNPGSSPELYVASSPPPYGLHLAPTTKLAVALPGIWLTHS